MILIFQTLYYVIFSLLVLMGLFVVYHIVAYSYSMMSKLITLVIFVSVLCILLLTNYVLFSSLPLGRLFSSVSTF